MMCLLEQSLAPSKSSVNSLSITTICPLVDHSSPGSVLGPSGRFFRLSLEKRSPGQSETPGPRGGLWSHSLAHPPARKAMQAYTLTHTHAQRHSHTRTPAAASPRPPWEQGRAGGGPGAPGRALLLNARTTLGLNRQRPAVSARGAL